MKKLILFLALALVSINRALADDEVWGYYPDAPLLTKAEQLSSNACSKSCASSEAYLIDGNEESYYHSSWDLGNGSPLPNAKHYLQWHLNAPLQHFIFTFVGMNWASAHNSPHDVTIMATNTPDDNDSWQEITRLQNMVDNPDYYPARYTSPHIDCLQSYTDFRMVVNGTTTGNKESTYGQYFFCLSEFQVFEAIEGLETVLPDGSKNLNLVFIGNSITYGATLGNPATEAPPVRVGELLREALGRPVYVSNCGVSGSTTYDWTPGSANYKRAYSAAADAVSRGGQIVFSIMLGTNDSAQEGPNGAPVSTGNYRSNLQRTINSLLTAYPQAIVVLNYPIWYSPTTQNGAVYLQAGLKRLQTYHPILDALIQKYQSSGKPVYPGDKAAYSFFEDNTTYFTTEYGAKGEFFLHPNAEGAKKLAEFWSQSIQDALVAHEIALPVSSIPFFTAPSAIYTLQGQPLPSSRPLPKGIYLMQGKKFIKK